MGFAEIVILVMTLVRNACELSTTGITLKDINESISNNFPAEEQVEYAVLIALNRLEYFVEFDPVSETYVLAFSVALTSQILSSKNNAEYEELKAFVYEFLARVKQRGFYPDHRRVHQIVDEVNKDLRPSKTSPWRIKVALGKLLLEEKIMTYEDAFFDVKKYQYIPKERN